MIVFLTLSLALLHTSLHASAEESPESRFDRKRVAQAVSHVNTNILKMAQGAQTLPDCYDKIAQNLLDLHEKVVQDGPDFAQRCQKLFVKELQEDGHYEAQTQSFFSLFLKGNPLPHNLSFAVQKIPPYAQIVQSICIECKHLATISEQKIKDSWESALPLVYQKVSQHEMLLHKLLGDDIKSLCKKRFESIITIPSAVKEGKITIQRPKMSHTLQRALARAFRNEKSWFPHDPPEQAAAKRTQVYLAILSYIAPSYLSVLNSLWSIPECANLIIERQPLLDYDLARYISLKDTGRDIGAFKHTFAYLSFLGAPSHNLQIFLLQHYGFLSFKVASDHINTYSYTSFTKHLYVLQLCCLSAYPER